MKTYTIRAICRNDYETSIEAESEDEAMKKAFASFIYWQEISPGGYDCEYIVVDEE